MLNCKFSKDSRSVFSELRMFETKGIFSICVDVGCLLLGKSSFTVKTVLLETLTDVWPPLVAEVLLNKSALLLLQIVTDSDPDHSCQCVVVRNIVSVPHIDETFIIISVAHPYSNVTTHTQYRLFIRHYTFTVHATIQTIIAQKHDTCLYRDIVV